MPAVGEEVFSNPLAPPGEIIIEDIKPVRLTNADFRKLILTPRAPAAKESSASVQSVPTSRTDAVPKVRDSKEEAKVSERKKKKSYYAHIKREEEKKMAELAEKYRDRAKERREGKNPDYQAEDPGQTTMGGYRAVAPDLKSGIDAAERRKQMIQESKFLGGDMEHTHLVKGLDYALLQKVRSEIQLKESENEVEVGSREKKPQEEDEFAFKTSVGRRIFNVIFHNKPPEFNDLFLPGRMAYAIDLEEEGEFDDIPTTVIRSKADLQGIENMQATFTTNDIVIQKLTQILSYLRTGRASKKQKKKEKGRTEGTKGVDDSIFGEIGDYVPNFGKPDVEKDKEDKGRDRDRDRRDRDRDREHERRDKDKEKDRNEAEREKRSYFSRPAAEEAREELAAAEDRIASQWPTTINVGDVVSTEHPEAPLNDSEQGLQKSRSKILKKLTETDYYTECYPGMAEMHDAIEDSDDEADYTKMDLGNKKGPVGRWDFDTQEEYSDYMNQREAMPKAAFQYGVKMADGRKTRRIGGNKEKDKNAELNREWQQIQQILKRRKETELGIGEKRARYDY